MTMTVPRRAVVDQAELPAVASASSVREGDEAQASRDPKIQWLRGLTWELFETLVETAFERDGFAVSPPGVEVPDGADLVLKRSENRYLVQCQQWKAHEVGASVVRELAQLVSAHGMDGGLVITTGVFTAEALALADDLGLVLLDGADLLQMAAGSPLLPLADETRSQWALPKDWTAFGAPTCPLCEQPMLYKRVRAGVHAGMRFWGCRDYPSCRAIREVDSVAGGLPLERPGPTEIVEAGASAATPTAEDSPSGADVVAAVADEGPASNTLLPAPPVIQPNPPAPQATVPLPTIALPAPPVVGLSPEFDSPAETESSPLPESSPLSEPSAVASPLAAPPQPTAPIVDVVAPTVAQPLPAPPSLAMPAPPALVTDSVASAPTLAAFPDPVETLGDVIDAEPTMALSAHHAAEAAEDELKLSGPIAATPDLEAPAPLPSRALVDDEPDEAGASEVRMQPDQEQVVEVDPPVGVPAIAAPTLEPSGLADWSSPATERESAPESLDAPRSVATELPSAALPVSGEDAYTVFLAHPTWADPRDEDEAVPSFVPEEHEPYQWPTSADLIDQPEPIAWPEEDEPAAQVEVAPEVAAPARGRHLMMVGAVLAIAAVLTVGIAVLIPAVMSAMKLILH